MATTPLPNLTDCNCLAVRTTLGRNEAPYAAVAAIKDYVAFYPDRVDPIEERPVG